ncbi:MAG: DNA cytosine methyltransferase [Corynebacterium casei]|uniref:Cytosine-specific methyltransferase n=2 Tax=Corynebacterium casei TaxID=160386 RepID=G7HWM0_9CORY|nr:DNA cytosine methyltransferase [Corynebacterium casei]AHI20828.1 DNA restriction-modification system, DNA methylase [Corynebacterium casei LMG S-19264]CCE54585.1 putative DNA (cytosine-5-)-methyltransferase [Corynebacterium casei UCMA 3821]SLM91661.1 Modification methylase NgoMIV [Corynebacterium casei]
MTPTKLTSFEICAGAGGQALGLEQAGFAHQALVEIDNWAAETLRLNRVTMGITNESIIHEADVHSIDGSPFRDEIDLFSGGVPCPPFSIAGKQLGADDDRDLFPEALRLIKEINPRAVLLENVKGLGQKRFDDYRKQILSQLNALGYATHWKHIQAADFGVPQLRPRFVLVALKAEYDDFFEWPQSFSEHLTVGEALEHLMGAEGWPGATTWAKKANTVAPTLVGGSKKHGGADVGPTRAKEAWRKLGVKGTSIAESAPPADFPTDLTDVLPRLTVQMGGVIQGFPENWMWAGGKTAQWRQVGNAFPPPVARVLGLSIKHALEKRRVKNTIPASSLSHRTLVV